MNEQLINNLCEKFHTTVENLIPAYAQYAMAKDIANIIIEISIILISTAVICFILWYAKKEDIDLVLDYPICVIIMVIVGIMIFICILALVLDIRDYILWSISPEMRFLDYVTSQIS